jgi:Family of unknown function (DUF6152)
MKRTANWIAALTALACVGALRAHHSISMFETSTPIWVKGTVVRYEIVNPHTMVEIEERTEGQVKRWIVEGPVLGRIQRMGVDETLLKDGDVIEVCGFALKEELRARRSSSETDRLSPPFVHGNMIVMPDGQMQPWGAYGKLENCVRAGDRTQSWLDFLNTDAIARGLWCAGHRSSVPTIAASKALVDEINRLMASPCQ